MDINYIREKLPLKPAGKHIRNIIDIDAESYYEIQKHYCLFKRANKILNETAFTECFGFTDEAMETGYVAECKCTACEETFYAGYKQKDSRNKSEKGIILIEGEDGMLYEGVCSSEDTNATVFNEGDIITCPVCGEVLTVYHFSAIDSEGEFYALRTQQVVTVEKYVAVITFEIVHTVSSEGDEDNDILPVSAVVIDEDGKLHVFINTNKEYELENRWEYEGIVDDEIYVLDSLQEIYYDDDSINCNKIGGIVDNVLPDLIGTTGEKTGLAEFIEKEGHNPCVYLSEWSRHRNIENLTKSPYGNTLARNINEVINRNIEYEYFPTHFIEDFNWINWDENKPHRMLGITKEELNAIGEYSMNIEQIRYFFEFKEKVGLSLKEYVPLAKTFTPHTLDRLQKLITARKNKKLTLNRILNYLKKQKRYNSRGIELFVDYIQKGNVETDELIYPKDLEAAHDRMLNLIKVKQEEKKYQEFLNVKKIYEKLEYTDGELCIVIPSEPQELIAEGDILCHCVGSYVDEHAEGLKIIFFVRHYRRPERSYYTLNIDFSEKIPKEVQLHGYGNERHGPNKEYSHTIPKKVRDFVDKWEKDVLMPWAMKRNKEFQKAQKKSA